MNNINIETNNNIMNNNIISKDAIRHNILNHIEENKINLNAIDENLNDLVWGEDSLSLEMHLEDEVYDVFSIAPTSFDEILDNDEEYITLLAKEQDAEGIDAHYAMCDRQGREGEILTQLQNEVLEVLNEILSEPRVYKLMKKDEDEVKVYDTFPETVDPYSIYFKWETDCDGNWHYWCEFEVDEDGEREDSGFSLDDASIWSDDYFVKWEEDMDDDEYQEALDESGREWNEAKEAIENNYYVFSELAEVA